jgi:hypothetical protein
MAKSADCSAAVARGAATRISCSTTMAKSADCSAAVARGAATRFSARQQSPEVQLTHSLLNISGRRRCRCDSLTPFLLCTNGALVLEHLVGPLQVHHTPAPLDASGQRCRLCDGLPLLLLGCNRALALERLVL